jgi:hypothetical protein
MVMSFFWILSIVWFKKSQKSQNLKKSLPFENILPSPLGKKGTFSVGFCRHDSRSEDIDRKDPDIEI